ncbi:type IV secretory system conjugative DNA transfer family protein [Arthrobacter sp. KNU40]|uniref:type IV secretory system conjugative DNA transfer family protein n=1 Tax=Arthrobacter sp. KNU40 TaxID=3447965 RepID=UPI003F632205
MALFKQKSYDQDRVTYRLIFPAGLAEERVQAWLSSITGTMSIDHSRLRGVPSIVFETVATDAIIEHYVRLPKKDASFIVGHLESLVPGIHAESVSARDQFEYKVGIELGMTTASRQLLIPNGKDLSASILASMQGLREEEAIVTQWLITPAPHKPKPHHQAPPKSDDWKAWRVMTAKDQATADEVDDRRKKLELPNMQAIGRIAVAAPHEIRAQQIIRSVYQAFTAIGSAANRLKGNHIDTKTLAETMNSATTPFFFKAQVNIAELAPLVNWPLGSPYIAGLPQSRTRHMHVTNSVPREGTVIGTSTVPGSTRNIAIDHVSRLQHTHIIGPTKSGKTWLATNEAVQDMKDGFGVVLIDPKGDLFRRVLERVPPDRIQDVIVWDLADLDHPIGFNVLRQGSSKAAIDELNNLVTNLFPETLSVPQLMYHGLHALAETGTLVDLPSFIKPNEDEVQWRKKLIQGIADPHIKKFWVDYLESSTKKDNRVDIDLATLVRRIWPFVSRAEIRNSLGQAESTFTMPDLVASGKILLVNLNGVRIGKQASSLMGTLILNALWSAVRTVPNHKPVMLYMDEFQNFVTMPTDPGDMLAESRSFGLGMTLIHQNLDQLTDRGLRAAISANCRSKIAFQLSNDAAAMAREFGDKVGASDLQNLQAREAIAMVATESGVSSPFTMRTIEGYGEAKTIQAVLAQSRAKYGRPVSEVEREIELRRTGSIDAKDRSPYGKRPHVNSDNQ